MDNSLKEVDKAEELGVDFVRIDLRNETLQYPDEITKIDTIVNHARSKGLKIYIGVYGMESWLPNSLWEMLTHPDGGAGKADWDDFKKMYKNQATYLADRYHPDYLMIMVELRFNLGNQVNSVRTIDEWVQFTKVIVDSVKNISPDTKIVLDEVARRKSAPSSVEYIKAIMQDNYEKIDIIAIDPYSYSELEDEVSTIVELRRNYNWHGEIWVGETNLLIFSDENEQKDYLLYAIDLADRSGFTGFCVFYFRDDSGTTGNNGILRKDFTPKPAYDAIRQIIQRRR
ncbi:MAG: hypothetical protein DRP63_03825 [Planctomycetota bacterium]|nr:MAG: hypothetical protein DRP63_03825 [Planctomycetota bacterium]